MILGPEDNHTSSAEARSRNSMQAKEQPNLVERLSPSLSWNTDRAKVGPGRQRLGTSVASGVLGIAPAARAPTIGGFAARYRILDDDRTVYLDALCSNALATLTLTLSDPATDRTFLAESLAVKVVDTAVGEHWRVRSATDTLSWDFSDAPEAVYAYLWRPNADSVFGDLIDFKLGKTPSLSLDLPPGDYLLDFYFPRVYDGGSWAAWSTNTLHVVQMHNTIYDACAGPALGTQTLSDYFSSVVDVSTPDEESAATRGGIVGNPSSVRSIPKVNLK